MVIVGIDPGTQRTGFAVLRIVRGEPRLEEFGTWTLAEYVSKNLKPDAHLGYRLERLHFLARELFARWNPQRIGMEKAVQFKNVVSAFKLSEARGVLRLAIYEVLASAENRLVELSPTLIKRYAVGSGRASKDMVFRSFQMRFQSVLQKDVGAEEGRDAYDALAVAWSLFVQEKGRARAEANASLSL